MQYRLGQVTLTDTCLADGEYTVTLNDLPDPQPECGVRLTNTTPLVERLWRIALSDVESNIYSSGNRRYFGAGKDFGFCVFTRDICYSGLLGLNELYPEIMFQSIRYTREVREKLGFRVSRGYRVDEINVPWIEEDVSEKETFIPQYHTNSYTRRTDDVIWLWCAMDLIVGQNWMDELSWVYDTGKMFFAEFYQPFFDSSDGLYRGQASFIDVHFPKAKMSGYPRDWSVADCVMSKSTSTNCLYVMGLDAMSRAAGLLGKDLESREWAQKRDDLKQVVYNVLKRDDGTFSYLKEPSGILQPRREALGEALAVLCDIVVGQEAVQALSGYPVTDAGVPLFHPFFEKQDWYHNNSSWPFVDTFFIKALEKSDGMNRSALNAALLARSCVGGSFHEVTDYRTREIKGSGSQLWTAAAFIDTCKRAGLIDPAE